jgi:hypothetical protein
MSVDLSSLGQIKLKGTSGDGVLSLSAPACTANVSLTLSRERIVPIGTNITRTLTVDDAGAIQLVSAAAARILTLPDPTTCAGCRFYFQISVGGANTITLRSNAANIRGIVIASANTVAAVTTVTAGATDVVFAANNSQGAWAELISDGTIYLLRGQSGIATGITFA